ncbi:unannotated protein [freshwater metagenome]|uniref:Unannotated protein n=1 Tax=freshwater metagenome TaxID=449393 RepID=A0A6J6X8M2_9ZZZZ
MTRGVKDGKNDSCSKRVLFATPLVNKAEAGTFQVLRRKIECATERIPVIGRPAQLELTYRLAVIATRSQIVASRTRFGCLQELLVVPGHGTLHDIKELFALLTNSARPFVVLELDTGPTGEILHGLNEVEMLRFADEGNGIALGVTAKAVVNTVSRVN